MFIEIGQFTSSLASTVPSMHPSFLARSRQSLAIFNLFIVRLQTPFDNHMFPSCGLKEHALKSIQWEHGCLRCQLWVSFFSQYDPISVLISMSKHVPGVCFSGVSIDDFLCSIYTTALESGNETLLANWWQQHSLWVRYTLVQWIAVHSNHHRPILLLSGSKLLPRCTFKRHSHGLNRTFSCSWDRKSTRLNSSH